MTPQLPSRLSHPLSRCPPRQASWAPTLAAPRCWRRPQSRRRCAALGKSTGLASAAATPSSKRANSARSSHAVRNAAGDEIRRAGKSDQTSSWVMCFSVCLWFIICWLRLRRTTWRASRNGTAIFWSQLHVGYEAAFGATVFDMHCELLCGRCLSVLMVDHSGQDSLAWPLCSTCRLRNACSSRIISYPDYWPCVTECDRA